MPVTVDTGQGQVCGCGLATVLFGDDMVGLVGKQYVAVVNAAIFATTNRPFPDLSAQGRRDVRVTHATIAGRWRARAFTNVIR